jgi:hypothetical protein
MAYDGVMQDLGLEFLPANLLASANDVRWPEILVLIIVAWLLFAPRGPRPRFKQPPPHPIPADDSSLLNRKPDHENSVL